MHEIMNTAISDFDEKDFNKGRYVFNNIAPAVEQKKNLFFIHRVLIAKCAQ